MNKKKIIWWTRFIIVVILWGLIADSLLNIAIPTKSYNLSGGMLEKDGVTYLAISSDDAKGINGISMKPTINNGNLALVQYVNNSKDFDFKKGQIINFKKGNGQGVIHRIIFVSNDWVIARGDANVFFSLDFVKKERIKSVVVGVIYSNRNFEVMND